MMFDGKEPPEWLQLCVDADEQHTMTTVAEKKSDYHVNLNEQSFSRGR